MGSETSGFGGGSRRTKGNNWLPAPPGEGPADGLSGNVPHRNPQPSEYYGSMAVGSIVGAANVGDQSRAYHAPVPMKAQPRKTGAHHTESGDRPRCAELERSRNNEGPRFSRKGESPGSAPGTAERRSRAQLARCYEGAVRILVSQQMVQSRRTTHASDSCNTANLPSRTPSQSSLSPPPPLYTASAHLPQTRFSYRALQC